MFSAILTSLLELILSEYASAVHDLAMALGLQTPRQEVTYAVHRRLGAWSSWHFSGHLVLDGPPLRAVLACGCYGTEDIVLFACSGTRTAPCSCAIASQRL